MNALLAWRNSSWAIGCACLPSPGTGVWPEGLIGTRWQEIRRARRRRACGFEISSIGVKERRAKDHAQIEGRRAGVAPARGVGTSGKRPTLFRATCGSRNTTTQRVVLFGRFAFLSTTNAIAVPHL